MADQARAGVPRAGFALLLTLSMAQFMVVRDPGGARPGWCATRVVPPGPPLPQVPQPHHLFRHHAGGIP